MDYSLVHAVWHGMDPAQRVIHFYDINCQYSRNLLRRVKGNQYISLLHGVEIQPGIGI